MSGNCNLGGEDFSLRDMFASVADRSKDYAGQGARVGAVVGTVVGFISSGTVVTTVAGFGAGGALGGAGGGVVGAGTGLYQYFNRETDPAVCEPRQTGTHNTPSRSLNVPSLN